MNRKEAEELLPWFVAGTLDADEAQAVQAFIDSGEISTAEMNGLSALAVSVNETDAAEPAYDPAILQRAMAQLDNVTQLPAEAPLVVAEPGSRQSTMAPQDQPGFWQRLADALQWATTPPLARAVVAAQFALLLGLGLMLGNQEAEVISETVAGSADGRPADFTVSFAPGTSEADIRALLLSHDLTIVGGPSALGLYQLAIPENAGRTEIAADLSGSPLVIFLQEVPTP